MLEDEDLDVDYSDNMNRSVDMFATTNSASLFCIGQLGLEGLKHFIRPNE